MASLLSENPKRSDANPPSSSSMSGLTISRSSTLKQIPVLDLDAILSGPSPASKIQSQDSQILYTTMKVRGIPECIEALNLLSREQFIRILDYDVWNEGSLVPSKAWQWLKAYASSSSKALYARFKSLDEEYQLALLAGRIEVYQHEDGLDGIDSSLHGELIAMPCNKVFYRLMCEDSEEAELLTQIIDAAMEHDMAYVYALINEVHMSLSSEVEFNLKQFREARISEDGFVSYSESVASFVPEKMDLNNFKKIFSVSDLYFLNASEDQQLQTEQSMQNDKGAENFLLRILQEATAFIEKEKDPNMQKSFEEAIQRIRYLANNLSAAVGLEADNIIGMRYLLQHTQALLSFGIEVMLKYDGYNHLSPVELFLQVPVKKIWARALAYVYEVRLQILKSLDACGYPVSDLLKYLYAHKMDAMVDGLDRKFVGVIDTQELEILKAFFKRMPSVPRSQEIHTSDKILFVPLQNFRDLLYLKIALSPIWKDKFNKDRFAHPSSSESSSNLH